MKRFFLKVGEYILVALLVVASTWWLGTSVLTNEVLLPPQASEQAVIIDELFGTHWWLISFFFSLIVVFMLYSIVRSAVVHGLKPDHSGFGDFFEGNTRLEVVWTIIPLGLVLWLAYTGAVSLGNVERRYAGPLEIRVIGAQWNWRFEYITESGDVIVSDVLRLAKDRPTELLLQSTDVIHSFWVPEFRVKQDALPGGEEFVRVLRITPNELGEYELLCAELCGTEHYNMRAGVVVMAETEFDAWYAAAAEEAAAGCTLSAEECGLKWATQYGCLSCHAVPTSVVPPTVGPTWVGLANSTVTLADGSTTIADASYLTKSILTPNAQIHSGYQPNIMPQNFSEILTEDQINQIVAFILSLDN